MMLSNIGVKTPHFGETQQIAHGAGKLMSRKIWLPKMIYNALPYFYLSSAVAALFATLYISDWFWVLPHYLLFAGACLHMGLLVHRRRSRSQT